MNKNFLTLSCIFPCLCGMVMLFGCNGSSSSDDADTTNGKADISALISDYTKSCQDGDYVDGIVNAVYDSMICDSVSSPCGNPQGLCTLTTWWTENPYPGDATLDSLVQFYNLQAYTHAILADYEIWERAWQKGYDTPMVPTDSIKRAILGMDISALGDGVRHNEAEVLRDEIVWCINNADDFSESRNPWMAINRFDSVAVLELLNGIAAEEEYRAFYAVMDSMINSYSSVQQEIASLDEDKRFETILDKVSNAMSFDDQCGIVMTCSMHSETYTSFWMPMLMQSLLQSGKYSNLLGRIWVLWRAVVQREEFGMSRDSYIPNYSFDKIRRQAFLTTLRHIHFNPDDRQAVISAEMFASHPILIRNGSFIMGNDATIEFMTYCPDFYGDEE